MILQLHPMMQPRENPYRESRSQLKQIMLEVAAERHGRSDPTGRRPRARLIKSCLVVIAILCWVGGTTSFSACHVLDFWVDQELRRYKGKRLRNKKNMKKSKRANRSKKFQPAKKSIKDRVRCQFDDFDSIDVDNAFFFQQNYCIELEKKPKSQAKENAPNLLPRKCSSIHCQCDRDAAWAYRTNPPCIACKDFDRTVPCTRPAIASIVRARTRSPRQSPSSRRSNPTHRTCCHCRQRVDSILKY